MASGLPPAPFATPAVLKAIRARLLVDEALPRLLRRRADGGPGVYAEGDVPPGVTTGEYLTVGPFSERPADTLGGDGCFGSRLSGQIKVISYSRDLAPGFAVLRVVVGALHRQTLDVEGYGMGWVETDTIVDWYSEEVAGVPVLHFPSLWRIGVHQTA